MEFVIILLLLGDLIVTFLLWQKNQQQTDQAKKIFEDQADQFVSKAIVASILINNL